MNIVLFFSLLVLGIICLLYCYVIQGVPSNELIWYVIDMMVSSWIGKCCEMIFNCALFVYGLCF